MNSLILLVTLLATIPVDAPIPSGVDAPVMHSNSFVPNSRHPICGIQAIEVAAKSIGIEFEVEDYLSSDFISSEQGSTIDDLKKIAAELGFEVFAVAHVDSLFLNNSSNPIILNLAVRTGVKCGGHWVTFLGSRNDLWKIYDPNATPAIRWVHPSDIQTRFRGVGLVVSKKRNMKSHFNAIVLSNFNRFLLLLLVVSLLWKLPIILGTKAFGQIAVVTLTFVFSILFFYFLNPHNVLQNDESAMWMTVGEKSTSDFPTASYYQIENQESLEKNNVFLVDARMRHQFEFGTIKGAKSIGVNRNIEDFRQDVVGLSRERPVVIFCNSKECSWSNSVAQRFDAFGFTNVSIFEPGLSGFVELKTLGK